MEHNVSILIEIKISKKNFKKKYSIIVKNNIIIMIENGFLQGMFILVLFYLTPPKNDLQISPGLIKVF